MVRIFRKSVLLVILLAVIFMPNVHAQLTSPSYKVDETYFGTGGELDASSPSYKAKQSAGEITVGNNTSPSYQFNAGYNTTKDELLEVAVTGGTFDLGILDPATTQASSTTFTIRNYLASGYVVRLNGTSLRSGGGGTHAITALTTPALPNPGHEQFGVNLAANTSPAVGSSPLQLPDNTFAYGAATTDYNQPNNFKFVDNDMIAQSLKSSGMTEYTLSFIANIDNNTPSGNYGASLSIVVIPTF
jgi:hypothetical protein